MPWIQNVAYIDIKNGAHYDPGPNNLLIQIVDCGMEFPEPKYKFNSVHQFEFLDLERDDYCIKPEMKITDDQAKSLDRKSTRLNSSHRSLSRMPSSA